ncbi:MAG: mechanosensitive ion channel [Ardenticatenales bacterium]|nr:mechanosensitive ion channel [Ardenticatenales bacterium]
MNIPENLEIWFTQQLPNIVQALVILLVGWLIALLLSSVVRSLMDRFQVDRRLNEQVEPGQRFSLANAVSQGVFWLILLFAIVGALDALQLGVIAGPFNNLLANLIGFIPNLIAAAILTLLAWVVATLVKRLIVAALNATNWDERLAQSASLEQRPAIGQSVGTLAYWLVWLLFLPGILDALNLQGLLTPVQRVVEDIVAFLPNLLSAAIIIIVGYFVARIVRDIVTNLLAATGIDRLAQRVGFGSNVVETRVIRAGDPATVTTTTNANAMTLSRLIGTLVFALILIPIAITALDALNLDALSQPAIAMLNQVLDAIPALFAAMILLAIAYFVGRLLSDLVTNILAGVGFDRILTRIGLRDAAPGGRQPSEIAGTLLLVGIMLFAAAEAASLLGFFALSGLITEFLLFFGNVLLGLVVLGLGLYLANLAEQTIRSSRVQNADLLATVARYSIIMLSIAMALRQMGIAEDIVTLAFGLLLGAIAVATAIAFGLGGREIAARELNNLVSDLKDRPQPPHVATPDEPGVTLP